MELVTLAAIVLISSIFFAEPRAPRRCGGRRAAGCVGPWHVAGPAGPKPKTWGDIEIGPRL